MKQIDLLPRNNVIRFNFDNGLTVRAQVTDDGVIFAELVKISPRSFVSRLIRKYPNPFGADAFADLLNQISRLTNDEVGALLYMTRKIDVTPIPSKVQRKLLTVLE